MAVQISPAQLAAGIASAARDAAGTDPLVRGADWQTATVTAVGTDGTVDIGSIRARRLDTYVNPAVGDQVILTQSGIGNWVALGRTAPTVDSEWTTYTPTVAGGGSVTWTTRTGWWKRVRSTIYVCVYLVVNAAGSGTSLVTVTMPTNVYRGTRQLLTMHTETIGTAGAANSHIGGGECVFFPTGSGAVSDRLRTDEGSTTARENNVEGADLLATGSITIQGWYREG